MLRFMLFILGILIFIHSTDAGILDNRLKAFDLLQPTDFQRRIVKRAILPSESEYNHIEDLRVTALDKHLRLTLTSKNGLFTQDLRISVMGNNGIRHPIVVDKERFYGGHVFGERQSKVNLHIGYEGQITGSVRTDSDIYYFEPADLHLPVPKNITLVYRKSDVIAEAPLEINITTCGLSPESTSNVLEVDSFDDSAVRVPRQATNSFTPLETRCGLRIVADYRFFNSVGGKSPQRTITYLINMIDRINGIYNSTNWNEKDEPPLMGYGFVIQAIDILNESTVTRPGEEHYNDHHTGRTSKKILDVLENGVLGLAYVGNGRRNAAGGVCSPPYPKEGRRMYLNSGLTSARNQYNQIVITREMELVTAHELGHNWGSQHDPESDECVPESRDGGRYLMYMYSVSGLETNNRFFSPCSRRSIREVLLHKAPLCFIRPEKSLCGNMLVEEGEQCDAGYIGAEDKDPCCDRQCRLRPGARCSDKNSVCCAGCQFAGKDQLCASKSDETCTNPSFCNGMQADCPKPDPVPNGTPCYEDGRCMNGRCLSFCETHGLKSCVCYNVTDSCLVCCRKEGENCMPYNFVPGAKLPVYRTVPNGRSCIQGHCKDGICERMIQDFSARVWLVIERIDFSNFVGFMKNNIVGVVIILSLIVWIPLGCLVHRYDEKFKAEHAADFDTLRRSIKEQSAALRANLPTQVRRPPATERRTAARTESIPLVPMTTGPVSSGRVRIEDLAMQFVKAQRLQRMQDRASDGAADVPN